MGKSLVRPKCEYCGDKYADNCKDYWRSYEGKYECKSCQVNRLVDYPTMNYQKGKKKYCENHDGRLGFQCPLGLKESEKRSFLVGCFVFLEQDHINENHNDNDPGNIQTLCSCCHNIKTVMCSNLNWIIEGKDYENKVKYMLKKIYSDSVLEARVFTELNLNIVRKRKTENKKYKNTSMAGSVFMLI